MLLIEYGKEYLGSIHLRIKHVFIVIVMVSVSLYFVSDIDGHNNWPIEYRDFFQYWNSVSYMSTQNAKFSFPVFLIQDWVGFT